MRALLAVPLLLLLPVFCFAVPVQVPYSGQLAENGELVTGTRTMTFRICPDSGSTATLAQQTYSVLVTNGVFHTRLEVDDSIFFDIAAGASLWIGVSVEGGPELPHARIGYVPLAVRALSAPMPTPPGLDFVVGSGATMNVSTGGWVQLGQVAVSVPAAGFLWVEASGRFTGLASPASFHDVQAVVAETPPPAVPTVPPDAWRAYESLGPTETRSFCLTRVLPVTPGSHTVFLWVRQVSVLAGGAQTNFAPTTIQALWVGAQY